MNTYHAFDKILKKNQITSYLFLGGGVLTFLIGCVMVYMSSQKDMLAVDKDGDVVSLTRTSSSEKFVIEADNHIRLLYSRFFSYDKSNYEEQVGLGLLLGGKALRNLYETYDNENWFDIIVNNDLIIESYVDAPIKFSERESGLFFVATGVQKITRADLIEYRHLDLEGYVVKHEVGRVKYKNPHGMKIVQLVLLNNKKIVKDD